MASCFAFTTKYEDIRNKLNNIVSIKDGDNTINAMALWDTGATNSCVSHSVVSSLNLSSIGKVLRHTPSGEDLVDTYCVDITLPHGITFSGVIVSDSEIGDQGIDILIGMDIITQGDFSLSNHNGKTVFTFRTPSQDTTDYAMQMKIQSVIGQKHGKGKRK